MPGLVRGIVECDWLEATTSGLPASLHAIGLGAGDFDAFWRFASKPGRTTPAVLVSPKFDGTVVRHALDVRALAAMLGTSARVYYSIDQDFCAEMDAGLPNLDLRCDGGTVRVYAPCRALSARRTQGGTASSRLPARRSWARSSCWPFSTGRWPSSPCARVSP